MNTREDKILNSLTGLQKTTAPDFFYIRLIGRMQNELPEKRSRPLLSPVILTISLSVVLVLNIVALSTFNHQPKANKILDQNESATIQSFANAYNLTAATVYE